MPLDHMKQILGVTELVLRAQQSILLQSTAGPYRYEYSLMPASDQLEKIQLQNLDSKHVCYFGHCV